MARSRSFYITVGALFVLIVLYLTSSSSTGSFRDIGSPKTFDERLQAWTDVSLDVQKPIGFRDPHKINRQQQPIDPFPLGRGQNSKVQEGSASNLRTPEARKQAAPHHQADSKKHPASSAVSIESPSRTLNSLEESRSYASASSTGRV